MAKRRPFTTQEERLQRWIRNAELKIVDLKGMIDTAERIVAAASLKVGDPASPQIIEVSEGGGLELGGGSAPWIGGITEEASHTGDTAETTIGTITIPANSMGPNGLVMIWVICKPHAASTFRVYFGQIHIANKVGSFTHATVDFYVSARPLRVWNKDNTGAQGGDEPDAALQLNQHAVAAGAPQSMSEDTTQDVDIHFTAQNAAGGDTSFLYSAFVEAFYRD